MSPESVKIVQGVFIALGGTSMVASVGIAIRMAINALWVKKGEANDESKQDKEQIINIYKGLLEEEKDKLNSMSPRLETLARRAGELEKTNAELQAHIKILENDIDRLREDIANYQKTIDSKDREIERLVHRPTIKPNLGHTIPPQQ